MASVLFHEAPPAVDELIAERQRTGADRFDEIWDGVYVVNPPPSFRHAMVPGLVMDLLRPGVTAQGLVVGREIGIGRPDDHRIPDVVVGDPADLDDAGHYLLTAAIAVEVLSPNERVDKLPFYLAHDVDEVMIVDPVNGTVDWSAFAADGSCYEPITRSTIVPLGPDEVVRLLDS